MFGTNCHFISGRKYLRYFICILANALLIISFPAFFLCCSGTDGSLGGHEPEEAPVTISFASITANPAQSLDIFVFNNDFLRRLDSHQRFVWDGHSEIKAASRNGGKIIVAVSGLDSTCLTWDRINSYETLQKMDVSFRHDNPETPLMSGEIKIDTGNPGTYEIRMKPVLSSISVRSIRCDFSSRPYAGEELSDVRVYLTNVNASAPIMENGPVASNDIINMSGYNEFDMQSLDFPQYVMRKLEYGIGTDPQQCGIELYCYPNENTEETAGTPFTRLVIEGKLRGKTYYYPININRDGFDMECGHTGIRRNFRYIYDLTITRTGSTDPDTPVSHEIVKVNVNIVPWEENGEEEIKF